MFIQSEQKLKLRSGGYLDASLIMQSKANVSPAYSLSDSHTSGSQVWTHAAKGSVVCPLSGSLIL
jgi:hypothetical protein